VRGAAHQAGGEAHGVHGGVALALRLRQQEQRRGGLGTPNGGGMGHTGWVWRGRAAAPAGTCWGAPPPGQPVGTIHHPLRFPPTWDGPVLSSRSGGVKRWVVPPLPPPPPGRRSACLAARTTRPLGA
jgi:hypothetical protein